VENLALNFPEGFSGTANILATYLAICNPDTTTLCENELRSHWPTALRV